MFNIMKMRQKWHLAVNPDAETGLIETKRLMLVVIYEYVFNYMIVVYIAQDNNSVDQNFKC